MNSKKRIFFTKLFLSIVMKSPFFTSKIRRWALIVCGAKIGKKTFIGQNVYFDSLMIQNIEIGEHCLITQNTSILVHFYDLNRNYTFGKVHIGNNVFIGMNSVICKPVSIGDNTIIGAGSIINKDIPANSFAAGVPVKVIKEI